MSYRASVVDAP